MSNGVSVVGPDGKSLTLYEPQPHQIAFHASNAPNLLALGTRGTGKSTTLRWDAIIRCLMVPNFRALILRRTMPDLRKALALDTPIPTPSGWTTMGALKPGDTVFAKDGMPTKVLWKSHAQIDPQGTYRVTFDNSESVIASAGHQWVVYTRAARRSGRGRIITTAELAKTVRAESDARANYAVSLGGRWQTMNTPLPIDPYVLGVWLGDGTSGQGAITTKDSGIVNEIRRTGYEVVKRPAHKYEWSVRTLAKQLEHLGVLKNKHVPHQYLVASPDQRLALLQGLMDTDGWCRRDNLCGFVQTNSRKPIAEAVYQLAASLGLKPRWNERPVFLYGRSMGTAYEVTWTGALSVFRLRRKRKRLNGGHRSTQRWHYIVACERISDTECQCIAVDHPSHEYLVGRASIPTHNSHLNFIDYEMRMLGGKFLHTTFEAVFPNGSKIQFSHCEKMSDVLNYLSSEWGFIGFDELSTFELNMFLQISAAARASTAAPYKAVVRACSNPLGIGAAWMKQWFVDKNVNLADYPDYLPDDFEMQFSTLDDNQYVDRREYEKRLRNLPEHVRRAWLLGEFVVEGAYFTDFLPRRIEGENITPWHVIDDLPTVRGENLFNVSWLNIYRAIDWGYWPDPAVCLWIAVLPDGRAIVFKERTWRRTLAADVAKQIKRESEGMHVVETFCDPSMFVKTGTIKYSIGELFEQNGVPLTPGQNDRELVGYSIHNYLNTTVDGQPQLQIVRPIGKYGCPELIRTLPILQMDVNNPSRLAPGEDHWAVALAYFCMGSPSASRDPVTPSTPRWMLPKRHSRLISGMVQ